MKNSELYYLLGHCLVLGEDPEFEEKLRSIISSGEIDYEKFVYMASSHLVTPLIYRRFLDNGILDDLPQELCSYLEEIYALNLARNRRIIQQMEEFTAVLNGHNIFPVLLKGAGNLADGLYKDPGDRMMIDIDILAPGSEFLKSVEILGKMGYERFDNEYIDIETCQHYPRLIRPNDPAGVEVHRVPVPEKYSKWLNNRIIESELKTPGSLPGSHVLSDRYKLLHCYIHGQLSHGGRRYGMVSFRDIYDTWLLAAKISDNEMTIPGPFIKRAADYFYLTGKITGRPLPGLAPGDKSRSGFLLRHHLNISSKAFYKLNLISLKSVAYLSTFLRMFTSRSVRISAIKRLSSGKWYMKQINYWKALLGFRGRNQ